MAMNDRSSIRIMEEIGMPVVPGSDPLSDEEKPKRGFLDRRSGGGEARSWDDVEGHTDDLQRHPAN